MYKLVHMKEPLILANLFRSYVPDRPTRGICIDLEIPKAKKGVFPPLVWWVHNYGAPFPRKFLIFHHIHPLVGRLEGIS